MIISPTQPSNSVAPIVNKEDNKLVLKGRVRSVADANSLCSNLYESDRVAARNRARVQSMIDGGQAKNQGIANVAAQGRETNINWGDGEQAAKDVAAPYLHLIFSQETFGSTPIKREYADDETRQQFSSVISEEMTAMVRDWPYFIPRKIGSTIQMVVHGISFDYHEDDINWQWRYAGMEWFKIPRPTEIGADNIKYCCCPVYIPPEDLWAKIKNRDVAKSIGWNIPAVERVLMKAAPAQVPTTDMEGWERYWKNNDYLMSSSKNVCPLIYLFVQELDGTVSQYLFDQNGEGEFLYKKLGRFMGMRHFVHVFIENIGPNGYYHGIRGAGSRVYAEAQTLNRKINRFSDMVDLDSSPIFQPGSEADQDGEATSQSGAMIILNPGWTMPTRPPTNYQQSLIPAISMFAERIRRRTGKIIQAGQSQDTRLPKHQWQAIMQEQANLSEADIEVYLNVWEGQWKEIVRRATRKGYLPEEPGGKEVAEFYRRCKERGVPPEAIHAVDWKRCKISRGLGGGSAAANLLILDQLEADVPSWDPIAQKLYQRDKVMARGGVNLADRYTPNPNTKRLPTEASLADLQNNQLIMGAEVPVREGQNFVVIAAVRLQKLSELNNQVAEGGEAALMQLVIPMHNILMNLQQVLSMANPNDPQVKQMKKLAAQFNEMTTNGLQHMRRLQTNAIREAQHNAGKVGSQPAGTPPGTVTPEGSQSTERGAQPSEQKDPYIQDAERQIMSNKLMESSIRLQERYNQFQHNQLTNREKYLGMLHKKELEDLRTAMSIAR